MTRRRGVRLLALLAAFTLIAASCSDDDGDADIDPGVDDTSVEGTPDDTGEGEGEGEEAPDDTGEDEGTGDDGDEDAGAPLPGAESVGVEGGSACGIPHGPYDAPDGDPAGEVRVAWNDPMLSYNISSSRGNATANGNPRYLMGIGNGGGFTYYDADLNYINNDSFGTCTLESLDPLSVTYRVNEGVTWSDGVPIDAADLLLEWAATSTVFNAEDAVIAEDGTSAAADADGNPIVLDADGNEVPFADVEFGEDGSLPEGFSYQPSGDVFFDAGSQSLELVTQVPVVSDDGLAVTATWDSFFVDYQTGGIGVNVPAHTVARLALGIEDPTEAKQAVIDAIQNDDREALAAMADVWNTGFEFTSLPDDEGLYLSAGPYVMTSYDELSQMTFEINELYDWGPQPQVATIVYRIIGDPTAAVQALQNEEVDIIQPQATADILTQVQGLADRGVEALTGNTGTYEHVDLVFDNGGPFDPATYGGDEATALAVRQAFLSTIPRQDIIDRLITPLNPEAILRDSFTTVVGAPTYDAIVAENGAAEYAEVDIEGAIALLEGAGVETPIDVRLHFADNNPRRANQYDLIAASAAEAGFNVIDGRSATWGPELTDTSIYDASLFGWQSTAVDIRGTQANFVTGGQNNFGGYSSEVIDGLYEQLQAETDPDAQQALLLQIEQQLYADAFGVPIFQHPGVTAFNSTFVTGVSDIPLSPTLFHDFWNWQPA